jgi:hypothetical protein
MRWTSWQRRLKAWQVCDTERNELEFHWSAFVDVILVIPQSQNQLNSILLG